MKPKENSVLKHGDEHEEHGQYFIYFSGHARVVNGRTMGIDICAYDIDLEKFVTNLAGFKSASVIAFFDCIKTLSKSIVDEEEEILHISGRYVTVFASSNGSSAVVHDSGCSLCS